MKVNTKSSLLLFLPVIVKQLVPFFFCHCPTFCPKAIPRMSPGTATSSVAGDDQIRYAELGKQPDLKARMSLRALDELSG